MSRAARARRVVTAAAYGGGGIGALGAAAVGVLYGETKLARRRIAPAETDPPAADGLWVAPGIDRNRTPIRMAMLGDSSAAGYGVHLDDQTPAAQMALGLSALGLRPVLLHNVARVGARSADLPEQVRTVLASKPEVAVVMVGTNDVTHRVRASEAVRQLAIGLALLGEAGVEMVVGTCPDLGTIRPISQPLRSLARRLSRNLAAAQAITVVAAGGRSVSMGDILGPEFATTRELFSEDRFHPSAAGYARAAEVLLPSVAAAVGLETVTGPVTPFRSRRARPVARAAVSAAARPGTEMVATEVHGQSASRRGPWVRLLRRRTSVRPTLQAPTAGADVSEPAPALKAWPGDQSLPRR